MYAVTQACLFNLPNAIDAYVYNGQVVNKLHLCVLHLASPANVRLVGSIWTLAKTLA